MTDTTPSDDEDDERTHVEDVDDGIISQMMDHATSREERCAACGEHEHYQELPQHIRECDAWEDYILQWTGEYGFLLPDTDSPIIWRQQTGGVMCHQKYINGHFIPWDAPTERRQPDWDWDDRFDEYEEYKEWRDDSDEYGRFNLLDDLKDANYNFDGETSSELWEKINDRLPFTYEKTTAPEGYPRTEEGFRWIHVTGIDGDYRTRNLDPLVDETIVLIYPNSD